MSKSPFFSIITPTYNRAGQLAVVIQSLQLQEFSDFEHIIVDDGSEDNTNDIVKSFMETDSRIIYLYQENQGRSTARNLGIHHAKGVFICFLDSDDAWNKEYLSNLKKAVAFHDSSFFATRMVWVSCHSGKKTPRPIESFNFKKLQWVIEQEVGMNVCVRSNLFSKNLFNASLSMNEDYELWTRIICQNSLEVVAVPNSEYYATTEEPFGRLESNSIDGMIHAQRIMQQNPCVQSAIPTDFWINRAKGFRLNKARALKLEQKHWSYFFSSTLFALKHPQEKVVPSLLLDAVYGLPGGKLLRWAVKTAKRTSR
ncbi:MAG: glycosyltransferase family 2 protein [Flavobacteriales bacterium]|nr:glycosyltransferase family 2 protein [Flavobacteriales bacterium]